MIVNGNREYPPVCAPLPKIHPSDLPLLREVTGVFINEIAGVIVYISPGAIHRTVRCRSPQQSPVGSGAFGYPGRSVS